MEIREISGKTVEEAIEQAEQDFGLSRDRMKITVLKEGRSGILGLGSEEAKIRVEPLGPEAKPAGVDITGLAKSTLQDILAKLDIQADVIEIAAEPDEEEGETPISFNIEGDDDVGILIGRHGQTLASLQYIVRVILAQKTREWAPVVIDVDGYKQRRYESLRATADRIADQVRTRKVPFTLEPMPAYERRIIHLALSNSPYVTTESVGEGDFRKVVIIPKEQPKFK